jgi:hypothetical protein
VFKTYLIYDVCLNCASGFESSPFSCNLLPYSPYVEYFNFVGGLITNEASYTREIKFRFARQK